MFLFLSLNTINYKRKRNQLIIINFSHIKITFLLIYAIYALYTIIYFPHTFINFHSYSIYTCIQILFIIKDKFYSTKFYLLQ